VGVGGGHEWEGVGAVGVGGGVRKGSGRVGVGAVDVEAGLL